MKYALYEFGKPADAFPDEGLLRLHKKQAIRKPTKRNQNSVYNAIHNSKSMTSGEALWIRDRDDLLALAKDAEHGWFNGILEDTLRKLSPKITLVGTYARILIPSFLSQAQTACSAMLLGTSSLCLGSSPSAFSGQYPIRRSLTQFRRSSALPN